MNPFLSALILVFCLASGDLVAGDIYKCEHQGTVMYSHVPCEPGAQPIDLPELGRLGSGADFEALRHRVDALKQVDAPAAARTPVSGRRRGLTFGERNELRKLQIRADGLRRDLTNWHRHSSYRGSLEAELDTVEDRIRQLEKKK